MSKKYASTYLIMIVAFMMTSLPAKAWVENGIPICTQNGDQQGVQVVASGNSGFIVVWQDQRSGSWDIYARSIDEIGQDAWSSGELAICTATGDQTDPRAASDGAGGIFVVWTDERSGQHIYGQHVFADGSVQWTANGAAVCDAPQSQIGARIVADGYGGAVTVWSDLRTFGRDIYAQRFDASGNMVWTNDGIPVCTETNSQVYPELAILPGTDEASTRVTVVWEDYRVSGLSGSSIYAQRMTLGGVLQWSSGGIPVSTSPGNQTRPRVVKSTSGSSIFIWDDDNQGSNLGDKRMYLKRVDAYGVTEWDDVWGPGFDPRVEPVDGGGILIVHNRFVEAENKSTASCQRFFSNGHIATYWPTPGVDLYYSVGWANDLGGTRLAGDGTGAFVSSYYGWDSGRTTIRVRRVSNVADPSVWPTGAVFACRAAGNHRDPEIILLDDDHAIVAWVDGRDVAGTGTNIYAQRLDYGDGAWGNREPIIAEITDIENDQGGRVRVGFERSDDDIASPINPPITGYNVWRRVDDTATKTLLANATPVTDGASDFGDIPLMQVNGRLFTSPSVEKAAAELPDGNWEVMGSFYAAQQAEYFFPAATAADSASSIPWAVFCVTAHTATPSVWYASLPDSGYSVDNVAPSVPQNFVANYQATGVSLDWDDASEPDFQFYRMYRSVDPSFIPAPDNLVQETAVSTWTDPTAAPWGFHYKVTVLDHAGNESEAGSPTSASGVLEGDVPSRTRILGAVPNPFNPSTKLSFVMAAAGHVQLKVYDAAGRHVVTLVDEDQGAGRHEVVWDGRDTGGRMSPAGVYLYQMSLGGFVETKRVTLIK